MRILETIIEHMSDTLKEANEYYRDYVMFKMDNPKEAQVLLGLAKDHMKQYLRLHESVESEIQDYRQRNGDNIPETMRSLWDFNHMKLTDEYDDLNIKINGASI